MHTSVNLSREFEASFKRDMFDNQLGLREQAKDRAGRITFEQAETFAQSAEQGAAAFRHALAVNDNDLVGAVLAQEIARQNLGIAAGTPDFSRLAKVGTQVMHEVHLAEARRYRGDNDDTPSYRALGLPARSEVQVISPARTAPQAQRPLSAVFAECRDYKVRKLHWKHSTLASKDFAVRLFQEILGDLRFDLISADHAATFDRALSELPAMMGKSVYVGMTAPEAAEHFRMLHDKIDSDLQEGLIDAREADRRRTEARYRPMEPQTRNKHINSLASVVTWARTVMKWNVEDHFAPFRMSKSARRKLEKKRIALEHDRLFEILRSTRFTGRKSDHPRHQTVPGNVVVKDGLYWAALFESHNGCRLDEGAKLRTFDVVEKFGMWCLKLNFEGDRLGRGDSEAGSGKSETSKRVIPLHPVLVKLGLPEQAKRLDEYYDREGIKDEERWLFPELTVSRHHKTRSACLTKRWATYLKTSGLYRQWEDGHALRHTFNDTMIRAGVPEAVIREFMGHSQQASITTETYFTASTLLQLSQELAKLNYKLPMVMGNGEWQIDKP
jgi:integrase